MNLPHDAASTSAGQDAQSQQNLTPHAHTKPHSLLRASALMASGTLVSRILGLVRSMMLLAVIGSAGGGVAAAFQTANTLPNTVFNILASGVFDAVLVPQIVGALKRKYDGETYINRLLTLAGVILFGITVISMVAAPLLVVITAAGYDTEIRALAILFALLCLPQLFFYGLYNLLGELLNARRVFGPYMWAPVVNNVIGILGLLAFLLLWGTTDSRIEIADFTSTQFWVLGGSATLGVIAQALILLIPMRRAGISFRPDFHFRGTSFHSASKVAGWTFATLMVSQIGILSTYNLASLADSYAKTHNVFDVVGINAYATAFMIFMVPQSLISVSLSTAIFTHMAEYAAERNDAALAKSYRMGVRTITFLVLLAAAILMAASVPMMQIVLPTQRNSAVVVAYAIILVALMPGVASTGIGLMSLRFFFAYEDVKPVFLFGIVPAGLQVVIGWSLYALTGPHWWVAGAAFAETFALIVHALIALFGVAKRNPMVDRRHILVSYGVFFLCAALAGVVAFLVLSFVGVTTSNDSTLFRFLVATGKILLVSVIATPVYLLALRRFSPGLSALVAAPLLARLRVPVSLRRVLAAPLTGTEDTVDTMRDTVNVDCGELVKEEHKCEAELTMTPDEVLLPSYVKIPDLREDSEEETLDEASDALSSYVEKIRALLGKIRVWCAAGVAALIVCAKKMKARCAASRLSVGTKTADVARDIHEGEGAASVAEETSVISPSASRIPALVDDAFSPAPSAPTGFDAVLSSSQLTTVKTGATKKESVTPSNFLAAQPSASSRPRRTKRGRYVVDPTKSTLLLLALVTIIAAIWALNTALSPVKHPNISSNVGTHLDSAQSALSGDEVVRDPAVISSVSVLSWNNDEGDNPDLAVNMIDQNLETSWNSRYFDINAFDENATVTLVVNLEKPALVSSVTLHMDPSTQGGQLVVRHVTDPAQPRSGTELTTSALSESTVISLPEPTETSSIALSFRSMPTSVDGRAWAWVRELSVQ